MFLALASSLVSSTPPLVSSPVTLEVLDVLGCGCTSAVFLMTANCFSDDAEAWHIENLVHYIRYTIARMQAFEFSDFVLKCESINQDWKFPEELLDSIKQENDNWS